MIYVILFAAILFTLFSLAGVIHMGISTAKFGGVKANDLIGIITVFVVCSVCWSFFCYAIMEGVG